MVSLTPFALAALAALPLSTAYVTGFTAPATAAAGSSFNATLSTALYSQNWDDFAIVWGLAAPSAYDDCAACVGAQIGYTTLTGAEGAAYPYTFTDVVTIPEGTAAGQYVLKAALPYLVGVSGPPFLV